MNRATYVLFVVLGALGLARHEMWRDELEIWLIARDSDSLSQLFGNLSTEGHPALWYLMNWIVARVSSNPAAMQLLHLAIAVGLFHVVYRHAPFSRLQRVLFCLGYYGLYEFTLISRAYGLQLLLFFTICALWARRDRFCLLLASLSFLLANTNLYGAIMAGCLVVFAWTEARDAEDPARTIRPARRLAALAIAAAGILLGAGHVFWQSLRIGSEHLGVYRPTYDLVWLARGLSSITYGFLPLPDPTRETFWNSNLLERLPAALSLALGALLCVLLVALSLRELKSRPRLMLVFALGATTMLCITLFLWYGQLRQHAQVFLFFLGCLWLLQGTGSASAPPPRRWLTVVLVLQFAAGAYSYVVDWARPFSNARAAAEWIEQHDPGQETIVLGSRDYAVQPMAAYMTRKIYYPESGDFRTFLDWGPGRRMVGPEEALRQALELRAEGDVPILMVLNRGPGVYALGESETLSADAEIRFVAEFTGAVVPDENYFIYRIDSPEASVRGD